MSVSYYTFSSQPYLRLHEGDLPLREEGWRSNYRHDELKNVYTVKDKEYEVSRIDLTDVDKGGVAWRVTLLVLLSIVTVGAAWFFIAFRNLLDEVRTRQEIVLHATFIAPETLKTDHSFSSEKLKADTVEVLGSEKAKESQIPKQKQTLASTGRYSPALFEAFEASDEQRFKALLNDENIDINAPDGRAHDPIVFQLFKKSYLHPLTCLLLRHPRFDPHVTNMDGQTPLEVLNAIATGPTGKWERFDTFGPLYKALFKKMDFKRPLSNGRLPVELLLNMEQQNAVQEKCFEWLVEASSEIDARTLACLASGNSFKVLRLGLQKCKNPNPQTEEDENPLELFLQNTALLNTPLIYQIRKILLLFKEKQANFYARNKENRTPFITFINTVQNIPYLKQNETEVIASFLSVLPEAYQNGYLENYPQEARAKIRRAIRQSFSTRTVKTSTDANSAQLMLGNMGLRAY